MGPDVGVEAPEGGVGVFLRREALPMVYMYVVLEIAFGPSWVFVLYSC